MLAFVGFLLAFFVRSVGFCWLFISSIGLGIGSEIRQIKGLLPTYTTGFDKMPRQTPESDFWFIHLEWEFGAHTLCGSSTHQVYLLVEYELLAPTISG